MHPPSCAHPPSLLDDRDAGIAMLLECGSILRDHANLAMVTLHRSLHRDVEMLRHQTYDVLKSEVLRELLRTLKRSDDALPRNFSGALENAMHERLSGRAGESRSSRVAHFAEAALFAVDSAVPEPLLIRNHARQLHKACENELSELTPHIRSMLSSEGVVDEARNPIAPEVIAEALKHACWGMDCGVGARQSLLALVTERIACELPAAYRAIRIHLSTGRAPARTGPHHAQDLPSAAPRVQSEPRPDKAEDPVPERAVVGDAIARHLADATLPPLLRDMLQNHWTRLPADMRTIDASSTLADLVWSVRPKTGADERQRLIKLLPDLIQRLHAGLEACAMPGDERQRFFTGLVQLHARAVKSSAQPANGNLAAEQHEHDPDDDAPEHLQRGDWIELHLAGKPSSAVKLTWISPARTMFLFANQQGARAVAMTRGELAHHFKQGQAVRIDAPSALRTSPNAAEDPQTQAKGKPS